MDVELGIAKDRTHTLQHRPSTPLKRGGHCIVKIKSFVSPCTRFTELSVSNNAMYGGYTYHIFFVSGNRLTQFFLLCSIIEEPQKKMSSVPRSLRYDLLSQAAPCRTWTSQFLCGERTDISRGFKYLDYDPIGRAESVSRPRRSVVL